MLQTSLMSGTRRRAGWPLMAAIAVAGVSAPAALAAPVPCAGGTLSFTAASDTPVALPTFNVGQRVTLTANAAGFTPASYAWSIEGPHLKDYDERVGTAGAGGTGPIAWSTSALAAADLAAPAVSFYWKPSPSQIHPMNAGPAPRVVTLTVTAGAATCVSTETYQVERNMTDASKQAVDFYTSTHRAPTETNALNGRVMDDHIQWHRDAPTRVYGFLAWHGEFLRRFNLWRAEFGYAEERAWNPGTPLPSGVEYEHFIREPSYSPLAAASPAWAANQIPTYYTIAGGTDTFAALPGLPATPFTRLAQYTNFAAFQDQFEFTWHGTPHCNIGPSFPNFFTTTGPGYGSMCMASSPKDPIFWRWHGFIDVIYRNWCYLRGVGSPTCRSPADAVTDLWLGDNAADIAANGAPPSPGPRWISPDVWNRSAEAACSGAPPDSGAPRDCGSEADHENPVAGTQNFLYATIRNDRPSPAKLAYAEVAVYIANASTGLSWPADFTLLPQSRQFIALNLEPGQSTDIGPLRWTPPDPSPSDHFCLYVRVLSAQDALNDSGADEGANVDVNTRDHNSIAWRNVTVLPADSAFMMSSFMMRNIGEAGELGLRVEAPADFFGTATIALTLDEALAKRWSGRGEGLTPVTRENARQFPGLPAGRAVVLTAPKAGLAGFRLAPRETGAVTITARPKRGTLTLKEPITITQVSAKGADGGVTIAPGRAMKLEKCRGKACLEKKAKPVRGYRKDGGD